MDKTIGERLREQRERNGLTLGQVAEYDGLTRQYLSNLELGRNEPSVWPLLAKLARRYNVSADYLLGLTDDPLVRLPGPASGEMLALLQRLTALPDASQSMALELLAVVARHEEARIASQFGDWSALHSLLSKMVDESLVQAVSHRLSDREIVTLSDLLRLAQTVKQDEVNNEP